MNRPHSGTQNARSPHYNSSEDGTERLYFVVETKSSLFTDDLRDNESAKIECGKAHFKALAVGERPAEFVQARNIDDLMAKC